jgi:hypothetical protein
MKLIPPKLAADFLAASAKHLGVRLTVRLFANLTGLNADMARWWVRYSPTLEGLRLLHPCMQPPRAVDPVAHVAARCATGMRQGIGCWEWLGSCTPCGVPQMRIEGYTGPVRRWLYEALNAGPQPKGMRVISRCLNERCVAPHHMLRMSPSQYSKWLHREHISNAAKRDGARRAARLRGSTLSDELVAEIRSLARQDGLNGLQISQRIGRSHSAVCDVLSGRSHNAHMGATGAATVADARKSEPVNVLALAAKASVFRIGAAA